jgi:hypothetical protein
MGQLRLSLARSLWHLKVVVHYRCEGALACHVEDISGGIFGVFNTSRRSTQHIGFFAIAIVVDSAGIYILIYHKPWDPIASIYSPAGGESDDGE